MSAKTKLFRTRHFAIALTVFTALLMTPSQILSQQNERQGVAEGVGAAQAALVVRNLTPKRVFLFNDNAEINSTTEIVTASLSYRFHRRHRLIIDYSSVGAIRADSASNPAVLFIGCFVDGTPCVGTQTDPGATPAGWVNVLSCDFATPSCAAWDSDVGHVWFSKKLSADTHTVVIKAAVGNPLVPFLGTGTLFNEARNLVVTVLVKDPKDDKDDDDDH